MHGQIPNTSITTTAFMVIKVISLNITSLMCQYCKHNYAADFRKQGGHASEKYYWVLMCFSFPNHQKLAVIIQTILVKNQLPYTSLFVFLRDFNN